MNSVFGLLCGCLFLLCFFLQHIHKDGNGHEGAVFSHSGVKRCLIQKFLAVCADKEGDGCAAFGSFTGLHFIINAAVAAPFCRLCTLLIGKGINLDRIGYHKSRIEPQTEMSDNLTAFVLGFPSNLERKSVAPENAIWLMYFLISSAVMPIPLSIICNVFLS